MTKKKSATKITHQLTLDEYDELTFESQVLGAQYERAAIVAHLVDVRSQVMGVKHLTSRQDLRESLMEFYDGITGAIDAIQSLPKYENRVGCPECGGWD